MPTEVDEAMAQDELTGRRCGQLIAEALEAGRPALDEAAAKQVLAAYGVPVPAGGVVHSAPEAVELAASLGGPVVLKAAGALIQHKTEAGLVLLDLRTPDEVAAGYATLAERAGDALEGVLVEQMVSGTREFLIGMKRDAAFGPVVTFGLGGTMTEVFRDIVLAIPPVADGDVAALLDLIKAKALLGPFRGQQAVDRDKLVAVFQAVARLAAEQPRIAEIDVNPLLIAGDAPVAADALIVLGDAQAPQAPARRAFTPDIEAVLAPKSVAIVGASDQVVKWGGSALKNILAGGFEGAIYPIHPKGGEFFGLPVYTSLADTPEPPDMALLAVGANRVPQMIEECGRRGVRCAVAIAAGFGETGEAGEQAERDLEDDGRRGRRHRSSAPTAWASSPTPPGCTRPASSPCTRGPASWASSRSRAIWACSSRSSPTGATWACAASSASATRRRSAPWTWSSTSRDDAETASVLMYLEGIEDGRRLLEVAHGTSLKKPVVVLRGGLTELGGKAAASHTGAMAGSAAVYEAAARQTGLVTCTSVQEALDLTTCLAHLPLPAGRRVAIVTNGGGAGVLATDEMARHGLVLPELPEELRREIDAILPSFWSRRNPLDMVAMAGGDVAHRVLTAVAESPAFDAVLVLSVLGVPNTGDDVRAQSARRRLRRLQPLGEGLPRPGRRPHGGDRQAHHQRPRPAAAPGAPSRRSPVHSCRGRYAAQRRARPRAHGELRRLARRPRHEPPNEGPGMSTTDVAAAGAETAAPQLEIMSGNEAVARGAWEAGVRFASAYPGTPSTEILESLSGYDDVYTEWAPNEKVALEAAIGASMAGARALACMKHVGLNVAADPFFSASHVGVTGGFVIVSADDPDMHSSQDEQDNRNYAKFAKMPMVEASDADEARRFLKAAYDISERFDAPGALPHHDAHLALAGRRAARRA